MAREAGLIVARGASTWLVRVYLGGDSETGARKYHKQTIHRSAGFSQSQASATG